MKGYTDAMLEAAYAVAVDYLNMDKPAKVLQIAGALIFLEPRWSKPYRLAGIAAHRMQAWELALLYYEMALAHDPRDGIALIYCGEVKAALGRVEEAQDLLAEGCAVATGDCELHPFVKRAKSIEQFLAANEESSA